jgi:adenosylcobinamide-phosphate guanylyltransferase
MCGGRGTRLGGDTEKPLVPVDGTPMVDRVRAAAANSAVDQVHAVVSPHTPETRRHLEEREGVDVLVAPGDGYVQDLGDALSRVDPPVLTLASDLPLLAGSIIDRVLDAADGNSLAVYVDAGRKRRLGVSVDSATDVDGHQRSPTGVNVVGVGEAAETLVVDDDRLAVNVNRPRDLWIAEALL